MLESIIRITHFPNKATARDWRLPSFHVILTMGMSIAHEYLTIVISSCIFHERCQQCLRDSQKLFSHSSRRSRFILRVDALRARTSRTFMLLTEWYLAMFRCPDREEYNSLLKDSRRPHWFRRCTCPYIYTSASAISIFHSGKCQSSVRYLRSSHYEYTREPSWKTNQKLAPAVVFPGRISFASFAKCLVIFLFLLYSTAHLYLSL